MNDRLKNALMTNTKFIMRMLGDVVEGDQYLPVIAD